MSFGERALISGEGRAASCTATDDVKCLRLSSNLFKKILGSALG